MLCSWELYGMDFVLRNFLVVPTENKSYQLSSPSNQGEKRSDMYKKAVWLIPLREKASTFVLWTPAFKFDLDNWNFLLVRKLCTGFEEQGVWNNCFAFVCDNLQTKK